MYISVCACVFVAGLQVVGRVNKGMDVLELLGDVPCGPDDSPLMRLKLVKCGATNAEVCHTVRHCFGLIVVIFCRT